MRRTIKISLLTLVLTVSLVGSAWAGCPVGDMNGDCKVDWEDLLVFAGQWLDTDSSRKGIVAHWKLDGNADDSVGGNHGAVHGNPVWTIGKIDGALDLDGDGDYVDCGNDSSLDLTNNFSISAWFKPDNTGLFQLVCKGNDPAYSDGGAYTILCLPDILAFYVRGSNDESRYTSTSVSLNEWTHVVGTFSDGNIKIYKDGVFANSRDLGTSTIHSNTGPLGIGADGDGETPFSGIIDDVRIYGRALSEAEVQEITNLGMPDPNCADLDRDGNVDLSDFSQLAENWQKEGDPLVINEFMAKNSTYIQDPQDPNEYDDWIEIYNTGSIDIDIGGMYLTDDLDEPTKWRIPGNNSSATTIGPYGHLLIWADKQSWQGPLHVEFALGASGEEIGLFDTDGNTLIDSIIFDDQVTNISYGRYPDAGDAWRFMGFPTPETQNNAGYLGQVADTEFSHNRGFYVEDFNVTITCDTQGDTIRYTTDSSAPTETHGDPYVAAIPIEGTTCLRVAAFKPGYLPSNVDTQTYIFVSDVKDQSLNGERPGDNWPNAGDAPGVLCRDGTLCGVMQYMNYGMDPEVVNNPAYSGEIEGALLSIPSISISTNSDNLFDEHTGIYVNAYGDGIEWERPSSMELIYPDGSEGFQIDMGLRIRGGWSRMGNNPKHAFRCFFRGKYGDSKLRYPLFGEEGVDEFDKIDLRADQNHSWGFCNNAKSTFVHEVFTRDTQGAMGQPYTRSRYYHLYLNGHYWGLFQTQERSEARYAKTYMGGETDDYDVVKSDHTVISYTDGSLDAYERLYNAAVAGFASNANYFFAQGMNPDGTENPGYEKLLDIDNLIVYNLVCYYMGGIDCPLVNKYNGDQRLNNLYCIYNRNNPDGWKFFIHDAEHTFGLKNRGFDRTEFLNVGGNLSNFNPVWLHERLFDNVEYRVAFADAVHKHMFNGGALSEEKCFERLFDRLSQVEPAIVAESARWGDAIRPFGEAGIYLCGTRSGDPEAYRPATKAHWESAIVRLTNFMTGRTATVLNQIKNRSELFYPSIDPPVLRINSLPHYGGYIPMGGILSMTNPNGSGTVYCTLDGSDPRSIGGAVNPAASIMGVSTTEVINETTHVKARIKSGSTWSALNEAVYADDRIVDSLRISEIMYHPADPNTEFIELQNIGTEAINLNLVKFTKGIDFTFGDQTLTPGQHTVIVQDQPFFEVEYGTGLNIAGQYIGRLDNDGDRIEFQDAVGTVIQNFKYEDNWYELTDGLGFSLTMVNPASTDPNDWDSKFGWRSSLYAGGTPGQAPETALAANSILINELLAHSHAAAPDWIELYNVTGQEIDISGWFLSDDDSDPNMMRKYQIPDNTVINAGAYKVFREDDSFGDPTPTGNNIPFGLSEGGETVYLYSGQGGEVTGLYQTQQKFDASETDISFGRYEKAELSGGYDFVRMLSKTDTAPNTNSGPLIPDIVITEIYYHPENGTDYEFVELYNRSGSTTVTLETTVTTETSPGVFVPEVVTWRLEGTGYEFPPGVTIEPDHYILLAKNPANYSSAPCDVYGPYDGKLNNGGEELEIQIPGDQEYGKDRYWIPIEKIDYDDVAPWPWPATPDGGGDSLHRSNINTYGRDYSNWNAATPTPGS